MGKYETLKKLRDAGLPVPPTVGIDADGHIDPVSIRRSLGCPEGTTYAVRSSCGWEDGNEKSYAGQFLTLLGVHDDELDDAIRRVADSYSYDVAYRFDMSGREATGPRLVIVQPLIETAVSGVAFTSDPMGGFVGETVLTVGIGLGEGVVSDAVETATWHVSESGDVWVTGDEDVMAAINSEMARTVSHLARRCRKVLGTEADMEFAIDQSGHVWVLQARPITVIAGKPAAEALASTVTLDNSNIVESYPGVVLPLTQGFVTDLYHRLFKSAACRLSCDETAASMLDDCLSTLVVFSDWHAYYRIESWYALLSLLPFSERIQASWRSALGITGSSASISAQVPEIGRMMKARVARRFMGCMHMMPQLMEKACSTAAKAISDGEESLSRATSFEEAWGVYESLCDKILPEWDVTLLNDIAAFTTTALAGGAQRVGGASAAQVASMRPVLAFDRLVGVAESSGMDSEAYACERDRFVADYGDRCIGELKLETRTWRSDPTKLDEAVRARLEDMPSKASGIPELPDKTPIDIHTRHPRRLRNRAFSERAKSATAYREQSRLLRTRMFGVCRAAFHRCGDFLVQAGVIDHSHDVFYLRLSELHDAAQTGDSQRWRDIIRTRKNFEQAVLRMPTPPRIMVVDGSGETHPDVMLLGSATSPAIEAPGASFMHGTGTSAGVVTAPVMVIDGSDLTANTNGRIIVTTSTDPGWAFLIANASGIIAERGSLLSHTSIISRELGIPAVVGVRDATRHLSDGDVVAIDGERGTVRVLSRDHTHLTGEKQ